MVEQSHGGAMSVTLRPVGPDDEAFLFGIYAETRNEELAQVPWDEAQREAFLKMQFKAQRQSYLAQYPQAEDRIILFNDQQVGRIMIAKTDREFLLVDIALSARYRKAGIGTALINDLLAEAALAGKPVRLHVLKNNRAVRLYERLGFSTVKDSVIHLQMEWRPGT